MVLSAVKAQKYFPEAEQKVRTKTALCYKNQKHSPPKKTTNQKKTTNPQNPTKTAPQIKQNRAIL